MKSILVNLAAHNGTDVAGDYAISLAAAFDAHILGVAFAYVPGLRRSPLHTTAAGMLEEQRRASEKAAQAAASRFDAAARRAALSAASRIMTTTLPGAPDLFGPLARRFDMSVVAQAEPNKIAPEELIIEAALFGSGRPALIVPYIHKDGLKLDRVLLCWDGGRAAARAFGDAMPLLRRATAVDVVAVTTEPPKSDEIAGADVAEMLARHGLAVALRRIGADGIGVANTILNHAADTGANLIVMGGYGHSRLREFVLGGTTREMLAAMTVPTLMSH